MTHDTCNTIWIRVKTGSPGCLTNWRCVWTRYLLLKEFYAACWTVLITPADSMNLFWSVSMKWQPSLNYILILYVVRSFDVSVSFLPYFLFYPSTVWYQLIWWINANWVASIFSTTFHILFSEYGGLQPLWFYWEGVGLVRFERQSL